MIFIYIIIVFIFGLLVGSFLNVLIYRYNSSLPLMIGRSKCFSCGKELSFLEMIPILSFIIQKGKCSTCGSKISIQYPAVEFITGLVFTLIFYRQYTLVNIYSLIPNGFIYLWVLFLFYIIVASILIVIAFYDFKHKVIPDGLVYLFIVLSISKLAYFIYNFGSIFGKDFYDLLAPVVLFGFFWLIWFISRGLWIGFGDVKLAFGIGALLGFISGISAIILGFWMGAIYVVILFLLNRIMPDKISGIHSKMEIPFAPFLIIGLFISLMFRVDVLNLSYFIG